VRARKIRSPGDRFQLSRGQAALGDLEQFLLFKPDMVLQEPSETQQTRPRIASGGVQVPTKARVFGHEPFRQGRFPDCHQCRDQEGFLDSKMRRQFQL